MVCIYIYIYIYRNINKPYNSLRSVLAQDMPGIAAKTFNVLFSVINS